MVDYIKISTNKRTSINEIIPKIKHTSKELFLSCSDFQLLECIANFKKGTGEIIISLNTYPVHQKVYVSVNKLILKIPEILGKVIELELDLAEEYINNVFSSYSETDKFFQDSSNLESDSDYYELLEGLLETSKDLLSLLKGFVSLLKTLKTSIKKNSNSNSGTGLSSNSSQIVNQNLISYTQNTIISEEFFKETQDILTSLLTQCDNIYTNLQKLECLVDTCYSSLINSVFNLIVFLDSMFKTYNNTLILNYTLTLSLLMKGRKIMENLNVPHLSKSKLFSLFFSKFYTENNYKFHFLLNFITSSKKQAVFYNLQSLDEIRSNISGSTMNNKNNINTINTNTNSNNNSKKIDKNNSNVNNNNTRLTVSTNTVRNSIISITNESNYFEVKENFKKELQISESIRYNEYIKEKLGNSYDLSFVRVYFNRKKFMNGIYYNNLDLLSKHYYKINFKDKDICCIFNIIESFSDKSDKLNDDESIITALKNDHSSIMNLRFKSGGYFYLIKALSSYIFVCVKYKDKYENYTSNLFSIFTSVEEKIGNKHVWETLNP